MVKTVGRSTKYETTGGKIDMGVGKTPSSKSQPLGKGTGVTYKTGKTFYANATGKVKGA